MTKKNFTRKDLSNSIFKELGFSKNFSSTIVDDFFEILIQHLVKFRKIKISSFGTFEVINKNERIGRNPKTKKEAKITSRKVVKFKPSLIFKKKINKSNYIRCYHQQHHCQIISLLPCPKIKRKKYFSP